MIKPTIAFYTQGCRLNQSETAVLEAELQVQYQLVPLEAGADVVVVNTCTVTENGDADTRKLVNKINRINPETRIALIGCQSQILKEQLLALDQVKWVIGNHEKMNFKKILEETWHQERAELRVNKIEREAFTVNRLGGDTHHVRASIKIQDGCDFYCAFCVIPFARGPARSRVFEDIIRECLLLVEEGHQEIVITGINVGTYENQGKTLLDVIEALEQIPLLRRIRISSIEPTTIPKALFEKMKVGKLCPYLHIPIQSGSDKILRAMNRHYNVAEFRAFIEEAKREVPEICIGTDVIVGFPGEDRTCFDETVLQLMTLPLDYFHVFSYSERKFARSKKLDEKVSEDEIARRSAVLRSLSEKKRNAYYQKFLGQKLEVLFEGGGKDGLIQGYSSHFIRVKCPIPQGESPAVFKNKIRAVTLWEVKGHHVLGSLDEYDA